MNKTGSMIIAGGLVIAIGIIFFGQSKNNFGSAGVGPAQNVEVRDGIQYITINAKGGYSPRVSSAQANMPTKLVIKTSGTYDCSSALIIRSIGYQKILPHTGEEVIDVGKPQQGSLQGVCSMGMYNFAVNFK